MSKLDPNVFALKVVSMHMEGTGIQKIARTLSEETGESISHRKVTSLLKSPECQRIMTELNEAAMATAKSVARQRGASLIKKTMDVIEYHLDEKNLMAVPHVLKITGVIDEKEQASTNQALTIIMPGADQKEKPVIEVKDEDTF